MAAHASPRGEGVTDVRAALAGSAVAVPASSGAHGSTGDGPDLRLAGLALGTWLATVLALRLPQHAAVTLAAASGLAAAVTGLVAARLASAPAAGRSAVPLLLAMVPVFVGGACGSIATAARTIARDAGPVPQLVARHATVHAELTLTSDPRLSRGSTPARQVWVIPATVKHLVPDLPDDAPVWLSAPALILGTGSGWQGLLPGQRVAVTARLSPPQERDLTVAVLSVRAPPQREGRPPWYQRLAGRLRAGLQQACSGLPVQPGGLLPGLVDGDTSRMDPQVRRDFEAAGMTYLVVVAGTHLAIALGCVLFLARRGRLGPRLVAGLGLVAIAGFAVLARPGPSVARGAMMAALGLFAVVWGRPKAALPALTAAVFLLLMINPQFAVEVGFTLSTLATAGLLLLVPAWRDRMGRRGVRPGVATAIAVPLAAQLACAPVVAATFGMVGVSAVPANMLAAPALEPAMVLGLGATALAPVSPGIAHALAWIAAWPCRWMVVVARYAARVPGGVVPWPTGLVGGVLLTALLLVALALWEWRPALVVVPVTIELVMLAAGGVSGVPKTGRSVSVGPAPESRPSQCQAKRGPLPDPTCTPGSLNPNVTQDMITVTICRPGWTATIRPPSSYTNDLKRQQIDQYGYLDRALGDYEEDHLVPLSVGGNPTDPRNLWPEPGASPNAKDKVEADLQGAVCTHQVSLASAQQAIATDWTTAEQRLGIG
jgi:competence protein ComEC